MLAGAYQIWRRPRERPGGPAFLAVGALALLALASAAWSARVHRTEKSALAFLILILAAAALADATARRPEAVRRILEALYAGATLVALLGLLLLSATHTEAVQAASTQYPARYRGIGQNPNTVPLLLALAMPLGLWLFETARTKAGRIAAATSVLLLDGSIVASGSRGALIAALAGSAVWLVTVAGSWRRRLALVAVAAAVFAADVAVTQIPKAAPSPPPSRQQGPAHVVRDAQLTHPLEDEIGNPATGGGGTPIRRTLFGTSGRARAWDAALHQAARRPVAGYGFGTERFVFVDRYYGFDSSVPENSYIGVLLQLGIVGLVVFLGLGAALAVAAFTALRGPPGPFRAVARACTAVLVAAAVLGLTQSYLTSVGNIAIAIVWIPALLLPALAAYTRGV